jgi:glycosyltransferase involved in cell wall biosynthesis
MKPPTLTTLISCKNHGKYLSEAIESIEGQMFHPTQMILINDGSTDNTEEVIQKEKARNKNVISITHDRSLGNIWSYNEGIDKATGEYFHLMAADDILSDKHFYEESVLIMMEDPEIKFCSTGLQWMDQEKTLLPQISVPPVQGKVGPHRALSLMLQYGNFINGGGTLIRTAFQRSVGYYDFNLPYSADWLNWIKCFEVGAYAWLWQKPGYWYRRHESQMTHKVVADIQERNACTSRLNFAMKQEMLTK